MGAGPLAASNERSMMSVSIPPIPPRLGHALMTAGSFLATVGAGAVRSHSEAVQETLAEVAMNAYHLGRKHERHGIEVPEHFGGQAAEPDPSFSAAVGGVDQGAAAGPLVDLDALRQAVDDRAAGLVDQGAAVELDEHGAEEA